MELIVPVHPDLLANVMQARRLNNKYETNMAIKYVAAYYVLKSLTTSGVIKRDQEGQLCKILSCTYPTLRKILFYCERAGYLNVTQHSIVLTSYTAFQDCFDTCYTRMIKLRYDYTTQKFHHIMEAAYLQYREQERGKVFENKIQAIPELLQELSTVVSCDDKGKYSKPLQALQIHAFKYGHEKMSSIFALNPFTTANSKTLRNMFKFKSEQSVAYLKEKLKRAKLVTVSPQRIPSQTNQRIKKRYIDWDQRTKQTIWVMPDALEYAPILANIKN